MIASPTYQPDVYRIAALGRRFDDPLQLLRGVLNAAILTREPGQSTVVADVRGLDLGTLPLIGQGGYRVGASVSAPDDEWRVVNVINGESVVLDRCRP